MNKHKTIYAAKAVAILSVIPVLVYAFSAGPLPRKTGAPGDGLCTECHIGTANSGSGNVTVSFPDGLNYSPGVTQRLAVTVSDPQAVVYGFQLTARLGSYPANGQAGDLKPADGSTQVLCEDGSAKPAGQPCPASAPVQFIENTLAAGVNIFTFDWTPPAAGAGDVEIYVAGNAANGNGQPTGDHIYTANFTLAAQAGSQKSVIGQAQIANGQLPNSLDGVKVRINNEDAFVYYISPAQINVQAPGDGAAGPVSVQVITPGGTSDPATVDKQGIAPGLFTWNGVVPEGEKFAGALFPDSNFSGNPWVGKIGLLQSIGIPARPAKPGETILFFATGCGPTQPAVPADQVAPSPAPTLASSVVVRIGGIPAAVAQNTGFLIFAGECQFNVTIPDAAPDGDLPLELEIGGVPAQSGISVTVQR